jgi:hypothetical protein
MEPDRNIIPLEPWRSWRGNLEDKSSADSIRSCQMSGTQVAGAWRRWGLEGVLTLSHQSGKTWLWCHSGLTTSGTWRVLRQPLPGLLLWQPSQPSRKKLEEIDPVLCGRLLS